MFPLHNLRCLHHPPSAILGLSPCEVSPWLIFKFASSPQLSLGSEAVMGRGSNWGILPSADSATPISPLISLVSQTGRMRLPGSEVSGMVCPSSQGPRDWVQRGALKRLTTQGHILTALSKLSPWISILAASSQSRSSGQPSALPWVPTARPVGTITGDP